MSFKEKNSYISRYLHASFKFASTKPAYQQGLRVAIIVGVPILIGLYIDLLSMALMFMLAALNVTLVDMGGMTYRKTARVLLYSTLLNASAAIIAQWASFHIATAVIITFAWVSGAAMLGLLGNSGVMMAFVNSAIFVIVVSNPNNEATTIVTLTAFVGGGLWATLLSLFAWPFRPYMPVRKAIANCYKENAAFLTIIAEQYHNKGNISEENQNIIDKAHLNFRLKMDGAYNMLSNQRQGRFSKSEVEDSLISLLHSISKDHRTAISLMVWFQENEEHIDLEKSRKIENLFLELAEIHNEISRIILHPKRPDNDIFEKVEHLREVYQAEKEIIISGDFKEINIILLQILDRIKHETLWATWQHPKYKYDKKNIHHETLLRNNSDSFFTLVRHNMTFKSSGFRHAIRIGVTSSVAVLIAHLLNLPHGYWLPLTVVVIMAPDFGGSFLIRTLQRGTGTILGGLLALLIISQIHNQLIIVVFLIIMTFLAISMLTINYTAFVFFLTPLIVTMYAISDIGDWHIPLDRVLDTLTGMALALIGGQLLFPDWERNHFPSQLSAMLISIMSYYNSILSKLKGEQIDPLELISFGRGMELSASNANASFQRTLTQPGFNNNLITPMMSFLASSNMLIKSIIGLHEFTEISTDNFNNVKYFVIAGQNTSELMKQLSNDILLQKNQITNEKIEDIIVKMKDLLIQTRSMLSSVPEESLPIIELYHIIEAEQNMVSSMGTFLSNQISSELPSISIFDR